MSLANAFKQQTIWMRTAVRNCLSFMLLVFLAHNDGNMRCSKDATECCTGSTVWCLSKTLTRHLVKPKRIVCLAESVCRTWCFAYKLSLAWLQMTICSLAMKLEIITKACLAKQGLTISTSKVKLINTQHLFHQCQKCKNNSNLKLSF